MVSVITEEEFAERIRSNVASNNPRPLVVDCFTDWCPPCKVSAPVYESLSKEYTAADFVKINVDKNPGVAHKLNVRGVPTFAILRGNKIIAKIVGADMRKVESKIKEAIKES
ncbi:thiol reductase thioredoxin [Candidatus Heimdallarchaeota archaeon B3_Heim]|nr:MAG: thiol reductase thioredoxin [Candidatus Heimdallarchaeota archaeon B3_Heim]